MALEIPSRYLPVMKKIVRLPEAAFEELIEALEASNVTSESDELASLIAARVPSIPKDDLHSIVDGIYTLYRVREFSELSRNRFVPELVDGIREKVKPTIPESETPKLLNRFQRLLKIEKLETISKAIKLQRDVERIFCGARIISDIRPVFGEDVESKPEAATITHTLNISYHENGDHKEFFVVLDSVDLETLFGVIERAKSKSDTLTDLLRDSNIPRLGL